MYKREMTEYKEYKEYTGDVGSWAGPEIMDLVGRFDEEGKEFFLEVCGMPLYQIGSRGTLRFVGEKDSMDAPPVVYKPWANEAGFKLCTVYRGINEYRVMNIGRLVAERFVRKGASRMNRVRYKDGDRWNTDYRNLEWCRGETRKFPIAANGKPGLPVTGTDPDGNTVTFPTVSEAERRTGLSRYRILHSIKKGVPAGGWTFKK